MSVDLRGTGGKDVGYCVLRSPVPGSAAKGPSVSLSDKYCCLRPFLSPEQQQHIEMSPSHILSLTTDASLISFVLVAACDNTRLNEDDLPKERSGSSSSHRRQIVGGMLNRTHGRRDSHNSLEKNSRTFDLASVAEYDEIMSKSDDDQSILRRMYENAYDSERTIALNNEDKCPGCGETMQFTFETGEAER